MRTLYVTPVATRPNVSAPVATQKQRESGLRLRVCVTPLLAAVLVACAPQSEPRTVSDFMEDGLARDGVLARCKENSDATLADEECANARRAASALALEAERARAPGLERESEAKLLALRERAPSFDVYADGSDPLGRRSLEIAEAEPPSNELVIAEPQLEMTELAVVPKPVRDDAATR